MYDGDRFFDTWIASQVLNYRRPHKHGLAGWGEWLKYHKGNYDDWSHFSETMMEYCVRDVKLNSIIYRHLLVELGNIAEKNPLIRKGLRNEMAAAKFDAECRYTGWAFNKNKANLLLDNIERNMHHIEKIIEPIQSRCQTFQIIPPTKKDVAVQMNNVGFENRRVILQEIINGDIISVKKLLDKKDIISKLNDNQFSPKRRYDFEK